MIRNVYLYICFCPEMTHNTSATFRWPELRHMASPSCVPRRKGKWAWYDKAANQKQIVNWNKDARPQCRNKPDSSWSTILFSFDDSLSLLSDSLSIFTLPHTKLNCRTLQCVLLWIVFLFQPYISVLYLFPPYSDFLNQFCEDGFVYETDAFVFWLLGWAQTKIQSLVVC